MAVRIILLLCLFPAIAWAGALTVTVSGVASPKDVVGGGVAELRERALDNAKNEASQRAGENVSQKQNERRQEIYRDGKELVDSSYDRITRALGRHDIRLVTVLAEGTSEAGYFVRAVYEIFPESEAPVNLGFVWGNVGKPGIFLSLEESLNGRATDGKNRMYDYLRDILARNGVSLLDKANRDSFRIHVSQFAEAERNRVAGVDVHTARCRTRFALRAPLKQEKTAAYRYSQERKAGFNQKDAIKSCYETLAPQLAEGIIRSLASAMRDTWEKGKMFRVVIRKVGEDGARIIKYFTARNIDGEPPRLIGYNNGVMLWEVTFDGSADVLGVKLEEIFRIAYLSVKLKQISGGTIVFTYGGKS